MQDDNLFIFKNNLNLSKSEQEAICRKHWEKLNRKMTYNELLNLEDSDYIEHHKYAQPPSIQRKWSRFSTIEYNHDEDDEAMEDELIYEIEEIEDGASSEESISEDPIWSKWIYI